MSTLVESIINKIAPIYPQAKRWLHSFNGGVFPNYHKEISSNQPVHDLYIPQRLILPLQQQVGLKAEVLVSVGEKVKKNQLIARSSKDAKTNLVVPIHAPTSGEIIAIEPRTLPHPSGLQDLSIVLQPDQRHDAIDNVLEVSGENPTSPAELKEIILRAGIVGMGGAGFPTYAKLPNEAGKIHTLLVNGAECEPFISCDDLLMQTEAEQIVQGALITAEVLGSEKIICGIETNKPSAIRAIKKAARDTIVEVQAVQTVYPMGGQKQLTKELTGIEIPYKAHAVDLGLLMMNVATFASIYKAVRFGEPLTSRMVSVTGLGLDKPFNIPALIGTPFIELANLAKPKTKLNYPLVMGGPMMGFAVHDHQVPVIKTTNCILVNPPQPVEMQMPCIRCGACMDACPINLLPQQMYWHSQGREFDKVEKLNLFDCIECGCCSYVCPSNIPLVQYYRNAKSEIKEIKAEEKAVELAKQRHEFKLARIEREQQEREAKLRAKKEAVKKQAGSSTQKPIAESNDKPKSSKASAAAAAARAAAAKRASAGKADSNKAIPAARRKAIEAAQKAANNETMPTTKAKSQGAAKAAAAKAAAMAAAKKRAQDKNSESADSATEVDTATSKDPKAAAIAAAKKRAQAKKAESAAEANETPIEKPKDPKAAAKAAAIAAAKKRAQAKKAESAAEANETPIEKPKDPKAAAKAAAIAAAKKRAQSKQEQHNKNDKENS